MIGLQTRKSDNPAILTRRALEDQRAGYQNRVDQDKRAYRVAQWEQATTNQIEISEVKKLAEGLRQKSKVELTERRQRLAALFANDEAVMSASTLLVVNIRVCYPIVWFCRSISLISCCWLML